MEYRILIKISIMTIIESWVELAPSRASLCSSIEAVNMENISGGNGSVNKDSRLSPVSLQSPHVEFESSLEQVKYRLVKDMVLINNISIKKLFPNRFRKERNPRIGFGIGPIVQIRIPLKSKIYST
jgi:hypothetical protein